MIYCNFKDRPLQSPENLLAGCCTQIISDQLPTCLTSLYDTTRRQGTNPTWKDITGVFEHCVASYDTIYIVLDALDECSDDVRSALLAFWKALPPKVRLLITTRHIFDIMQEFRSFPKIEIRASPSDLQRYTSSRIARSATLAQMVKYHASLEQQVCDKIVSAADGM